MGGGIKIFLKFKKVKNLFPKNAGIVYLDCVFSGIHLSSIGNRSNNKYIVWHSLLTGDPAEELKDKTDQELANILLTEMKKIVSDEKALMEAYEGVYVKHWTNEKYI